MFDGWKDWFTFCRETSLLCLNLVIEWGRGSWWNELRPHWPPITNQPESYDREDRKRHESQPHDTKFIFAGNEKRPAGKAERSFSV